MVQAFELMTVGAVVENKAALDMAQSALERISRVRSAARRARVKPTILLRGEETGDQWASPEEQ